MDVRIEAKWQQVSDSVNEQFPYTSLNAIAFREDHAIIAVGGEGFRRSAVDWLQHAADMGLRVPLSQTWKNVQVFDPRRFITWPTLRRTDLQIQR